MKPAARISAAASARPSRATRPAARSTGRLQRHRPAGIEYYLPLFFDETATLFDYLPDQRRDPAAPGCARRHRGLLEGRPQPSPTARRRQGPGRSWPPDQLFLSEEAFFVALRNAFVWRCRPAAAAAFRDGRGHLRRALRSTRSTASRPFCGGFSGRVLVLAESAGRQQTIAEYFAEYGLRPRLRRFRRLPWPVMRRFALGTGPLPPASWCRMPASPSSPNPVLRRHRRAPDPPRQPQGRDDGRLAADLSEGRPGDPVVPPATASAATWVSPHGSGRRPDRVPAPRIRQRRQALRAGVAAAS